VDFVAPTGVKLAVGREDSPGQRVIFHGTNIKFASVFKKIDLKEKE